MARPAAERLDHRWAPMTVRAPQRARYVHHRRGSRKTRATPDQATRYSPGIGRKVRRGRWRWRLAGTTCGQTRRSIHVLSFGHLPDFGATGVKGKKGELWAPASASM